MVPTNGSSTVRVHYRIRGSGGGPDQVPTTLQSTGLLAPAGTSKEYRATVSTTLDSIGRTRPILDKPSSPVNTIPAHIRAPSPGDPWHNGPPGLGHQLAGRGSRTRTATRRPVEVDMPWIVLIVSGSFEAVWANALDRTQGFTRPLPIIVFLVAMTASVTGLGYALRTLPTGTAYAVWTAVGASLTVVYAMITGTEPFSVARVLLLAGIVGCVIGLKALS